MRTVTLWHLDLAGNVEGQFSARHGQLRGTHRHRVWAVQMELASFSKQSGTPRVYGGSLRTPGQITEGACLACGAR
ncbi:hypothetical protein RRG08_055917 [Elysia crispata]|uniref:Uncharacterized protein n=1 Tax=Elysia crispata TaxID=231223 RepID=A0AAE0Y5M1_9GAST|nr:hypothetical protein RRG08_055917 [Elysia crispata]